MIKHEMAKKLIKKFENLRLVAYLCLKNVVTIGYGSTRYPDKTRVKIQDTITVEQAEDLLDYHLINNTYPFVEMLFKKFTKNANKYFGSEDRANKIFAATASLVYNVGSTGPVFLNALRSFFQNFICFIWYSMDNFIIYRNTKSRRIWTFCSSGSVIQER